MSSKGPVFIFFLVHGSPLTVLLPRAVYPYLIDAYEFYFYHQAELCWWITDGNRIGESSHSKMVGSGKNTLK